jgi:hypothetical protein
MVLTKPRFQFPRSIARLIVLTGLLLLQPGFHITDAQRRTNRRRPPAATKTKARDYSNFLHEHHRKDSKGQELACASCHTVPTLEFPNTIAAATNPTIKGFPYHESCMECHRRTPPQFFRSSTPIVCTVCHTRSSPRLTAKEVLPFPKPENVRSRELVGYFAHGSREHRNATRDCSSCHLKDQRTPVSINATAGERDFVPSAGTFRMLPVGHANCFANCHWDKDEPKKDQCAGCHFTPTALATKQQLSPMAGELLKDWPRVWPRRLSLKFNHDSKNHREEDNPELVCTKCHDTIRQTERLEVPDVKIRSCADSQCHFERTSKTSIRKEMLAEDEDIAEGRDNDPRSKAGANTCSGCHAKAVGGLPPPCSHYQLFDEKYFNFTDYPKSARQLTERCRR